MTEPAVAEIRQRTHRLIASRYPTVGVFETVASREDAIAAMVVESFTDDSLNVAIRRLLRMPEQDLVIDQAGASVIMAAFLHADVRGGRFTGPELGAWYCCFEVATAIAETVFHSTERLARSEAGFHQTIQMRELIARFDATFVDLRNDRSTRAELYDPNDYTASQAFGNAQRDSGANGICYASVRRATGTNLVVYRPSLLLGYTAGDRFQYQWTGIPEPKISRLTEIN